MFHSVGLRVFTWAFVLIQERKNQMWLTKGN